jgi:hypothetical protein
MPRSSSLIFLLLALPAFAADFKSPQTKTTNLILENQSLAVLNEQTVQTEPDDARRVYALLATSMSARHLTINSNENRVKYPVDSARGALGAQWGYLPFQFRGYYGLVGTVHYTYLEEEQRYKTALHWMTAELHAIYRYEPSRTAFLKPFIGIGGGSHVFVQRGPTGYDTSEAQGVASGFVGVAWNLSRTFKIDSPLTWELTAQYKRVSGPREELMDLNGEHYSLGMELAL